MRIGKFSLLIVVISLAAITANAYPHISPYAYCGWNPIGFIDPDGTDIYNIDENNGNIEVIKTEGDTHYYYLKNGDQSSFVGTLYNLPEIVIYGR